MWGSCIKCIQDSDGWHGAYHATFWHIFWSCAVSFWIEAISCIKQVLAQLFVDMHILPNYLPALWKLSEGQQRQTFCALTVAKRLVLKSWNDKCPPTFSQWRKDLMDLYLNLYLYAHLFHTEDNFIARNFSRFGKLLKKILMYSFCILFYFLLSWITHCIMIVLLVSHY